MDTDIHIGDRVYWSWGKAQVSGRVIELYKPQHSGAKGKPLHGLIIQLDDGRKILKLENEVNPWENSSEESKIAG